MVKSEKKSKTISPRCEFNVGVVPFQKQKMGNVGYQIRRKYCIGCNKSHVEIDPKESGFYSSTTKYHALIPLAIFVDIDDDGSNSLIGPFDSALNCTSCTIATTIARRVIAFFSFHSLFVQMSGQITIGLLLRLFTKRENMILWLRIWYGFERILRKHARNMLSSVCVGILKAGNWVNIIIDEISHAVGKIRHIRMN